MIDAFGGWRSQARATSKMETIVTHNKPKQMLQMRTTLGELPSVIKPSALWPQVRSIAAVTLPRTIRLAALLK
jgi:hypothetical protein